MIFVGLGPLAWFLYFNLSREVPSLLQDFFQYHGGFPTCESHNEFITSMFSLVRSSTWSSPGTISKGVFVPSGNSLPIRVRFLSRSRNMLLICSPSTLNFDILQDLVQSRGREGRLLKDIVAPMSVATLLEDPSARLENGDAAGKPSHYKNQLQKIRY